MQPGTNTQKGFSLLEALISVAILAIGFAGVYAMVLAAGFFSNAALEREEMRNVSNEIFDIFFMDPTRLKGKEFNSTMGKIISLNDCTKFMPIEEGEIEKKNLELRWCERLDSRVGIIGNQGLREIRIEQPNSCTISEELCDFLVVTVELTNSEGRSRVLSSRVFYDQ